MIAFTGGSGLNLGPGKDMVKIIPQRSLVTGANGIPMSCYNYCQQYAVGCPSVAQSSDLGPNDATDAQTATVDFTIQNASSYMACYKLYHPLGIGQWQPMSGTLNVTAVLPTQFDTLEQPQGTS